MSLIDDRLRQSRRECDERRCYRDELEALATRLRADTTRLDAQTEAALVAGNHPAARPLIARRGKVQRSIAAIEEQIGEAGVALAAAEHELKRYETLSAQRDGMAGITHRTRRGRRAGSAVSPIAMPDHQG